MLDNHLARNILAVGIILGAIAGVVLVSRPAKAVSLPSLQVISHAPAAFQTFESFEVTCATTATAIAPPSTSGMNFNSVYCENNSATSVFYGGSGVAAATAPCISTACPRIALDAEVARGKAFCLVSSGTIDIQCVGGS